MLRDFTNLKAVGHDLTGYYLVRFNSKRPKAILCNFPESSKRDVTILKNVFKRGRQKYFVYNKYTNVWSCPESTL